MAARGLRTFQEMMATSANFGVRVTRGRDGPKPSQTLGVHYEGNLLSSIY